jgi:PKD repeat protein
MSFVRILEHKKKEGLIMLRKRKGLLAILLLLGILLPDPYSMTRAGSASGTETPSTQPDITLFAGPLQPAADLAPFLGQGAFPCKKVLFLDDRLSTGNSDEFSTLKSTLAAIGFEIQEVLPLEITASLVAPYDVVVFSLGWYAGGGGQREITDAEAAVLAQFVNSGKSLFLVGELGHASWSGNWRRSLNRIGANFGITFANNMLCSSASHLSYPDDPDGGVDLPIIKNITARLLSEGVAQFTMLWGASLKAKAPAQIIARADASSWRDTDCTWNFVTGEWECGQDANEPSGAYPVIARVDNGVGRILAIGDSSWMVNGWIDVANNLQLAKNAFTWLARLPSLKPLTAKPNSGIAPLRVRLTCSTKDSGTRVAEYQWDFGDGASATIVTGNTTLTINHTYGKGGTYAASCTVVDKSGCSSTSQPLTVTVSANQAPVIDSFSAKPQSGNAPLLVNFTCNAHDPDPKGSITNYRFDFGDGNTTSSTNGRATKVYATGGTYNATCTAVDNRGAQTASSPLPIAVNGPPVIQSFTPTEEAFVCDNTTHTRPYMFMCRASDPEGLIARYEIAFGDNTTTSVTTSNTTVKVMHSYESRESNTYDAQCTVFDDRGVSATSLPVTVLIHFCRI